MNVDLITLLTKNYKPQTRTIYDVVREPLLVVTRDYISRVFDLDLALDEPIDVTLIANEYTRLGEIYKR